MKERLSTFELLPQMLHWQRVSLDLNISFHILLAIPSENAMGISLSFLTFYNAPNNTEKQCNNPFPNIQHQCLSIPPNAAMQPCFTSMLCLEFPMLPSNPCFPYAKYHLKKTETQSQPQRIPLLPAKLILSIVRRSA
jgi:hypothetical protein